jgi:uncharacterized protein YbaR (Trm112 family)
VSDPDRFVDEDLSDEDYAQLKDEMTVPILECPACQNRDTNELEFCEVNTTVDTYWIRSVDDKYIMIDATMKPGDVTTDDTFFLCKKCRKEFPIPEGMETYL